MSHEVRPTSTSNAAVDHHGLDHDAVKQTTNTLDSVESAKSNAHLAEPEEKSGAVEQTPQQDAAPPTGEFYRTASTVAPSHRSAHRDPVSRVTTDAEGNTYPEGGKEAWLVVLGSFLGLVGSLGLVNTIGTFQAYIQNNQLKDYSSGKIGWIFGMFAFLTFFCGVQVGPIFDARGPRLLVLAGSVFEMAMIILLGFCTQYWHFMLVIGVLGGIGASLIFTPAISAIGHFFFEKRGVATGIAATGGSVGGIAFPLILEALFPKIG